MTRIGLRSGGSDPKCDHGARASKGKHESTHGAAHPRDDAGSALTVQQSRKRHLLSTTGATLAIPPGGEGAIHAPPSSNGGPVIR